MKTLVKAGIWIGATFLGLIVVTGLALSLGKTLDIQHEPFAEDVSTFDYGAGTYEDYIAFTKAEIAAHNVDNLSQQNIDNIAPFVLLPGAECPQNADGKYLNGIVLTHGLMDTSYNMRLIGEYFQTQCFYVLGVLLPGHGTRAGDLLETQWEDWAQVEHFAASQLALHAEQLFLSGHSIGGELSLLEAAQNPDVDALILFAPAIAITDAARFSPYISLLGNVFSKSRWINAEKDEAVYRYESLSFFSVAETWGLINATNAARAAQTRQLPIYTVASMEDSTVLTSATLDYMATNTHPLSHTLLYSQHAMEGSDRITVVNSNLPEQGILSTSHLGLMTPPSHPWFGRDGTYRSCVHYGNEDDPLFVQCKNGERDFYGETTEENLEQGLLERIAFNPFYDAMLEQINSFVSAVN